MKRQQLYPARRAGGDLGKTFALAGIQETDEQAQGFAEIEAKSRTKRSAG
jgi:hypothetical protein